MYGNAAVETVSGIIHLYKTEYGFDISQGGPSKVSMIESKKIIENLTKKSNFVVKFVNSYTVK